MALKRMAVAAAAGYVFGAKAGRDRYEELVQLWKRVSSSKLYQRLSDAALAQAASVRDLLAQRLRARGSSSSTRSDDSGASGSGGRSGSNRSTSSGRSNGGRSTGRSRSTVGRAGQAAMRA